MQPGVLFQHFLSSEYPHIVFMIGDYDRYSYFMNYCTSDLFFVGPRQVQIS